MQVREWTHFRVRIRPDLHKKIKADAASGYRSINTELTMILEKHFARDEQTKKAPDSALESKSDASTTTL